MRLGREMLVVCGQLGRVPFGFGYCFWFCWLGQFEYGQVNLALAFDSLPVNFPPASTGTQESLFQGLDCGVEAT